MNVVLQKQTNQDYINLQNILSGIKDIKLSEDNEKINLYFKQLDFFELQKLAKDSECKILKNFVEKVETIHSYTPQNGKRVYDYKGDIKVKNKTEKIQKRLGYTYFSKEFNKQNNNLNNDKIDKIICGDSLKVLKTYPDNCVDLIFTSPPYNFGMEYDNHNDTNTWQKYFDFLFSIFDECIRVLKYGGRIIVNVQPLFSDYVPTHHLVSNYFFQKGLIWKSEILWEKNNYNCKYTAWGSWKSPSNPYMKYTWEFLEVFCKGNLKKDGKSENIDIDAEDFKKYVVAKWSIAPERDMKKYGHPAMFPEKLVEKALKLFSFKNDIILDPFNGAGTTSYVAKKLSRHFIGIDISKEYCETAEKRLKDCNDLFIK